MVKMRKAKEQEILKLVSYYIANVMYLYNIEISMIIKTGSVTS